MIARTWSRMEPSVSTDRPRRLLMIAISSRAWSGFFVVAALFNFAIGLPLMFAPDWTFGLAFHDAPQSPGALAPKLWGDFGFCVALIGVGYLMVAFDLTNRALVWLGIGAKAFDVIVLTSRWLAGITKPLVLLPAAIDAAFIVGFVIFLMRSRKQTPP